MYVHMGSVINVPIEKKRRKGKTTPFGVDLMRSQVLYRVAQGNVPILVPAKYNVGSKHLAPGEDVKVLLHVRAQDLSDGTSASNTHFLWPH